MGVVAVTSLLLLVAACGGEESSDKLDLVGAGKDTAGQDKTPVRLDPGPSSDLFTVDLIQDLVFRRERNGWGLATPEAHVNMEKLEKGGVDLVLSAIPGGGVSSVAKLHESISTMDAMLEEAGGRAVLVSSLAKALEARKAGRFPFMLLLEGADALSGDPDEIYELKRRGVGAIGISAGRPNSFGDPAVMPATEGGLTEAGTKLVQACRDHGILVDLTHSSPEVFWDVIVEQGSLASVTHTAARALRDHPRNLDDLQILALARAGGIMGLVFNPDFLEPGESPRADLEDVVRHMVHIKQIGALDALALGTDYGGIRPPAGLEDVSALPDLARALHGAGFSSREVALVMGGNARRLLGEVETRQGVAEGGREEPLRPISVECDTVIGEHTGVAVKSCDGFLLEQGPTLGAAVRLRLRLSDLRTTPARIEIFGDPGTPWQVEAQDLSGKVLMRRGVALDVDGRGSLPLPKGRNLTRVFLSPTRESSLREVVLWGR